MRGEPEGQLAPPPEAAPPAGGRPVTSRRAAAPGRTLPCVANYLANTGYA